MSTIVVKHILCVNRPKKRWLKRQVDGARLL